MRQNSFDTSSNVYNTSAKCRLASVFHDSKKFRAERTKMVVAVREFGLNRKYQHIANISFLNGTKSTYHKVPRGTIAPAPLNTVLPPKYGLAYGEIDRIV
uniref:Uncharacterized protein n=1 Tax=Romanomermis culicivorax TaxID=13658 RepID=A0A915JA86_ROMCU